MAERYWLFKSEPDAFSIDDLARNTLGERVKVGDGVLFDHSSCAVPAVEPAEWEVIVGLGRKATKEKG
ncbi:MAG: hypothetical protein CMJ85_00180 [Planctomycetes bacterium]|jgi:predicted RNA-binding protein with PUA-like domain|nr:hypothetical protein [Planctomycetota bacterium]